MFTLKSCTYEFILCSRSGKEIPSTAFFTILKPFHTFPLCVLPRNCTSRWRVLKLKKKKTPKMLISKLFLKGLNVIWFRDWLNKEKLLEIVQFLKWLIIGRKIRVWIPLGLRILSIIIYMQSLTHPVSFCFSGAKVIGEWSWLLISISSDFKNVWSSTSIPPHVFTVWWLLPERTLS